VTFVCSFSGQIFEGFCWNLVEIVCPLFICRLMWRVFDYVEFDFVFSVSGRANNFGCSICIPAGSVLSICWHCGRRNQICVAARGSSNELRHQPHTSVHLPSFLMLTNLFEETDDQPALSSDSICCIEFLRSPSPKARFTQRVSQISSPRPGNFEHFLCICALDTSLAPCPHNRHLRRLS
jgi:hypothetical protein